MEEVAQVAGAGWFRRMTFIAAGGSSEYPGVLKQGNDR